MKLIEHFFRLIAPASCVHCGSEGALLCAWCREDALPEVVERCYKCNALSPDGRTCRSCKRSSPISHLWTRTEYADEAKAIVHHMKFSYSGEAADLIGRELTNTLPALAPGILLVPVPTATNHIRERGFDHVARITRKLARVSGHQYHPALSRINQLRQVGSSRQVRLKQMEGAFRVKYPGAIQGMRIVLIDDVFTTGATIEAAARTLRAAGAKTVDALVFAKAK